MKNLFFKFLLVSMSIALFGLPAFGQLSPTGSITGTVTDSQAAVVPNASVTAKNKATGEQKTATTSDSGIFRIPAVPSGIYTVTVEVKGFKKTQVTDVKVDVGTPSTVNVTLEVGTAQETVTIVGGGEVIQSQSATIGTTLTGRQITDIPTASRDALDLVLALPGTTTPGRPRTSSINGLPKGALNITIDGVNVQDNLLKSNDGFFTYVRPRTDAISEVTVSTSNPGAESSGEGAFQIKFVTQGGGNQYHGGGYYYYRTPGLNANYWFNNRDLPPDPISGRAPRTDIILHQPGFKVGGPISIPKVFDGRDKAFFFVNYEEFRLPESAIRTRNVLSTAAQNGTYQFLSSTYTPPATGLGAGTTTCTGSGASRICSVNVYQAISGALANGTFVAANPGIVGAFTNRDPTIGALLSSIRTAIPGSKVTGDPNVEQASFINHGGQIRRFPTVRLDFNLTKNHHIENIWNYQRFAGQVDFLNNTDPAFPDFPNQGSQGSVRFSDSMAWRWTISNSLINEARYGIVGGTVLFFPEIAASQFGNQAPNGQGMDLSLGNFASGGLTLTSATVNRAPSRRNSPVREFSDNLSWIKGDHSFSFGATLTRIGYYNQAVTVVPQASYTISSSLDPAPFNAFAFLPSTQQSVASQLYGLLSGRLTAFNSNARLDEDTNKYAFLGPLNSRAHSLEWGAYGTDTWRFRPNITLTLGLRYERQVPVQADNDTWAGVSYAGLYGESGQGNLFKPGTLTGSQSQYFLFGTGTQAYNATGMFLPSFGFTYSPNFHSGLLRKLAGESGQTVFRGGFSIASVREGTGVFTSVVGGNPGGTLTTNRNLTLGNLPVGTYLRSAPFAPAAFPSTPVYPNSGLITDAVNAFNPNLKIGYVESWSFGIQREIKRDNVIEVRYTANRGHQLWRQVNLNETNVIENGVRSEFALAQQNLLANIAANRCQTGQNPTANAGCQINFAYFGPGTGTVPLPISLAYFSGLAGSTAGGNPATAANYSSANFRASTFVNALIPLNPSPLTFAGTNGLNSTSFENRRTPAGQACYGVAACTGLGLFAYNQFLVNPGKRGGTFAVENWGQTWYDAVTVEFRRRMSRGLLVQGSYTFGKALSNMFSSDSGVNDQPSTLRNLWLKKGVTNFDIRHGFKANFIYELPFGKGKTYLSNAGGWLDKLVGGWGFNGNIRVQSGSPFSLGNVQVVGMTAKELEQSVSSYRDPDGFIYVFPKDIRDNTVKAFNLGYLVSQVTGQPSVATISFTGAGGAPTGRFIAPAGFGNCAQSYTGQCGFANLVLHGPRFTRFDLAAAKKFRFSENINLELRAEFLNAFNNINFLVGSAAGDVNTLGGFTSSAFGRMTAAYQDTSTTNDPGGRVGQLVIRLNF
jgi:Carboxypeptidase regulatory-like domain